MKIFCFTIAIILLQYNSYAQSEEISSNNIPIVCVTPGVLNGGGSLIGVDIETLLTEYIGIQYGVGILGAGVSLCFHFKPDIMRSFVAVNYIHQGLGQKYVQSLFGASYVFRANRFITFQIGLAKLIDEGPMFNDVYFNTNYPDNGIILTYSIGFHFYTYRKKALPTL